MLKTVLIIAILSSTVLAKDDPLIKNGGFEKGMDGWMFINNSKTTTCTIDKKNKNEGKKSLYINKKNASQPYDVLRAELPGFEAGKDVAVSGMFKSDGFSVGWLKIFFYDALGNTIKQGPDVKSIAGGKKWKEIKIINKAPKGTQRAALFMLFISKGEVWIDNIKVKGKPVGAKKKRFKKLDSRTKSWLDRNALKIKNLEFYGSMDDLKPLKKILKYVRIVQLGEQSHGDGETFRAKARLIRFLYEEMGFEILAFESGLYECEMSNDLFKAGKTIEGMDGSVFGIWRVEQARPLYEYITKNADERNPLRLTGFDTRGSGRLATEFIKDIQDFLSPVGEISAKEKTIIDEINTKLDHDGYKPQEKLRKSAILILNKLRKIFDDNHEKLVENNSERVVGFYSQCLNNYIMREQFENSKNDPDRTLSSNIRDEQMAKNLRWLADVYYPDKKIVCWAATSHLAHNLKKVTTGSGNDFYQKWKNMGQYIHEWYGDKVYTIGFAAYDGQKGSFKPTYTLEPPMDNSFEDIFHRYGEPLLFVDLRCKNPFKKPRYCSPMSYTRTMKGPWPEVIDGLFYTQTMTASKAIKR